MAPPSPPHAALRLSPYVVFFEHHFRGYFRLQLEAGRRKLHSADENELCYLRLSAGSKQMIIKLHKECIIVYDIIICFEFISHIEWDDTLRK